jgi:hypothetical protein
VAVVVCVVVCVVLPQRPVSAGHTFCGVSATQTFVNVLHGPTVPLIQSSQRTSLELQSRKLLGHVRATLSVYALQTESWSKMQGPSPDMVQRLCPDNPTQAVGVGAVVGLTVGAAVGASEQSGVYRSMHSCCPAESPAVVGPTRQKSRHVSGHVSRTTLVEVEPHSDPLCVNDDPSSVHVRYSDVPMTNSEQFRPYTTLVHTI